MQIFLGADLDASPARTVAIGGSWGGAALSGDVGK